MRSSRKNNQPYFIGFIIGAVLCALFLLKITTIDFSYASTHIIELLIYFGLFIGSSCALIFWKSYCKKFEGQTVSKIMSQAAYNTAKSVDEKISNFVKYIPDFKKLNGLLDSFSNQLSEKVNSVIESLENRTFTYLSDKLSVVDARINQFNESLASVEAIPSHILEHIGNIEDIFKEYIELGLTQVVNESIGYQQEISNLQDNLVELQSQVMNSNLQLTEEQELTSQLQQELEQKTILVNKLEEENVELNQQILERMKDYFRKEQLTQQEEKQLESGVLNYALRTGASNDLRVLKLFESNTELSPKEILAQLPDLGERNLYNVLNRLLEKQLIQKLDRGTYTITQQGRLLLRQTFST